MRARVVLGIDCIDGFEQRVERCVVRQFQGIAARLQCQITVDVAPLLERPRRRRERHALVLIHAEIGEHELGPVLMQIAEEHQPEALAERRDEHAQRGFVSGCVPLAITPWQRVRGVSDAQRFEPFGLAQALERGRRGEHALKFGARRAREQFVE